MAAAHGLLGAVAHFQQLVEHAVAAVPDCRGAARLRALVRAESERLVPAALCDELAQRHAQAVA
jgi:geranylgeranyl diphosphate synthase, type II